MPLTGEGTANAKPVARQGRGRIARLARGGPGRFVLALGPTALALGVQLLAFVATARGLGVSAFGAYAAILAVSAIAVELTGLGGADLMVRAVSRDPARFREYFGNMLGLICLTLVPVVGVATLALAAMDVGGLDPGHVVLAVLGETLIGRISASVELAMVAHREVVRASLIRLATPIVRLACALGYFNANLSGSNDLAGWIEIVAMQSAGLSAIYLVIAARRYGTPVLGLIRSELGSGLAFGTNQTARSAQGNLDRFVLSWFASEAVVGVYAAGSRILQLGLFPLQVVTRILYPDFFVAGENGIGASRRFALKRVPIMLLVGTGAGAAVAAAGVFAPFVLGQDFARASDVTVLLSFSMPLIAMQYLAADALTGAGYQHVRAVIYAAFAAMFGALLALGAWLGGVSGMIAFYLGLHAGLALVLWGVAWQLDRTTPPLPVQSRPS